MHRFCTHLSACVQQRPAHHRACRLGKRQPHFLFQLPDRIGQAGLRNIELLHCMTGGAGNSRDIAELLKGHGSFLSACFFYPTAEPPKTQRIFFFEIPNEHCRHIQDTFYPPCNFPYAILIILVATMTAWIMALLLHLQPVQFPALSLTLPEEIVFRLLASFGGVFGFSLMFNSPRNLAVCAALIGAVTNTFRLELVSLAGFPPAVAAFLGALLSGLLASCLKSAVGYPRISVTVPSIVIMVPGLYFYRVIYNLGILSLMYSATWFADAILIIMALPLGLIFARYDKAGFLELGVSPKTAPDKSEFVELEFEKGAPVALNGEKLKPAAIIAKLNEIGGRNGIGLYDVVENRLVGMKSRGVYETPGGTILYKAHEVLETLTLDKLTAHKKRELAITFGELVYDGQWFSPLRKALSAFVTSTQEHVTGKVRLELYKGNLINAGVWSPFSLYREDIATFAAGGDYKQSDATGFISIYGLPTKVQAIVNSEKEGE